MRLVSFRPGRGPSRAGVLVEDVVLDLNAVLAERARGAGGTRRRPLRSILALIQAGPAAWDQAREAEAQGRRWLEREGAHGLVARRLAFRRADVTLEAPLPRPPRNVFCLGRNYAEHAAERGAAAPEHPVYFTKAPECVIGPGAPIVHHAATEQLDYEVELAVVLGRAGRDVGRAAALEHVFGYTVVNDVTARDLQKRHQQWFKGKSLDTFCPMGPVLVTADEIPDPQDLAIALRVNDETRQSSHTSKMIFPVAECIAVLSVGFTLLPGDVIATGTPEGVGAASGRFLRPGDRLEAEVERIGVLANPVVAP
ncbi:MAG: fumarylacetoacetate hydrolase family protein [Candidatus Rokubacteria bacterium]|nr:fumarylacetoacetate hydrolase family protein [Candidatus Rokubacteria bacterium]